MEKICFVISPMGDEESPVRIRADYVLKTYIEPACRDAGYKAVRAEHQDVQNLVEGITTALQNAPLTIAYMGAPQCGVSGCGGAPFWNANVMIEIGYRVASRLPLILISDRDIQGRKPNYPLSLSTLNVVLLPGPKTGATPQDWEDPDAKTTIQKIRQQIEAEQKRVRLLDCKHALASINANRRDTDSPEDLRYTAASVSAEDLFGVEEDDPRIVPRRRLVGRTMVQYLEGVRDRMHPIQWKMFQRDQIQAREKLKNSQPSIANVPIVFEGHENPHLNHRAYLPIVVQEFQPDRAGENNWYNLRVLYLNVTTVTKKAKLDNDQEYYVCDLDPFYEGMLESLKPFVGIKVFISYARRNSENVEQFLEMIRELRPYVDPLFDLGIEAGKLGVDELQDYLENADLFFVFFDDKEMGPGQATEVRELVDRAMRGKKPRIVPITLGDGAKVPPFLSSYQRLRHDELKLSRVQRILATHFPDRCPDEWEKSHQESVLALVQDARDEGNGNS